MEFVYKEKYKYPTNVVLNITDGCNLECVYCFVQQHPHFMTFETAKKVVDWMVSNLEYKKAQKMCSSDECCQLTFFGGEPTLLFDDIIVPIVKYCHDKYNNLFYFSMTTNGTLLNEERIKFLSDNNFSLLLSIDGAKETQDKNRPCHNGTSSFDLVNKNIPILLKYFPGIIFRSTIDENTVSHVFENYVFAESYGFKNYYVMPNGRTRWSEENKQILANEVEKIFLYLTYKFLNNEIPMRFSRIDEIYRYLLQEDINRKTNFQTYPRPSVRDEFRCGLGTAGCSIGYDGSIYGCQEQDSQGHSSIFYIGNINTGIDMDRHIKLLTKYFYSITPKCENEKMCNNCYLASICHHYCGFNCPSQVQDLFNDFNIHDEMQCFWYQLLAKNCLIMQKALTDNNCKEFKKYLELACYNTLIPAEKEENDI